MNKRLFPPTKIETVQFNKMLTAMCERKKCAYINLYPLFVDSTGYLDASFSNDGVHLNGKAYLLWKAAISKYVN
jgi:lysophospholipase L1-like esterase